MTELPRKLEKQGSIIDRLHAEDSRASADEARGGGKRPTHAGRKGSQIDWEDLEQQFRETLHGELVRAAPLRRPSASSASPTPSSSSSGGGTSGSPTCTTSSAATSR